MEESHVPCLLHSRARGFFFFIIFFYSDLIREGYKRLKGGPIRGRFAPLFNLGCTILYIIRVASKKIVGPCQRLKKNCMEESHVPCLLQS